MSLAVSDAIVRRAALVILLVLAAACGHSESVSPTTVSQPTTPPVSPPSPPRSFPPLSGPSRTFVFDRELKYPVADYTRRSQFVLYDNGAFALRFAGMGEYHGGYTEANGAIVFDWEGWSAAGPWGATGTINGNFLTVQYNLIMQLTDFEDAVYVYTVPAS